MVYQLKQDILSSQIGEEIVLLDVASGKYFKIDEIGSTIWEYLKEPKSIEDLVNVLMQEFEVEKERCTSDVSNFIEELKRNEFLVIS
jgi:hypothetical protein